MRRALTFGLSVYLGVATWWLADHTRAYGDALSAVVETAMRAPSPPPCRGGGVCFIEY